MRKEENYPIGRQRRKIQTHKFEKEGEESNRKDKIQLIHDK